MQTIKKFIIATIVISSLSPTISRCAMDSDNENESASEAAADQPVAATPMAPKQAAEIAKQAAETIKIQKFLAPRVEQIASFLPQALVSLAIDYVRPSEEQIKAANNKLSHAIDTSFDLQELKTALDEGAHADGETVDGRCFSIFRPPLYRVINNRSKCVEGGFPDVATDMIQILIDHKANANKKNVEWGNAFYDNSNTPLFCAVVNMQSDATQLLLDQGASVHVVHGYHITPLYCMVNLYNKLYWHEERPLDLDSAKGKDYQAYLDKCVEIAKMLAMADADLHTRYAKHGSPIGKAHENMKDALWEAEKEKKERPRQLTHLLLDTDILQQFISERDIISVIDDYAKPIFRLFKTNSR